MTTKLQRFAPAYLPIPCTDCGHLSQRGERLICHSCGAPRYGSIGMTPAAPTPKLFDDDAEITMAATHVA